MKPTALARRMVLLLLSLWLLLALPAQADEPSAGLAYLIEVKGPITPVVQAYIERGIRQAEGGQALLVVMLNTPGGSLNITREVVELMRASRVPIVVYVAPSGATAASAGTIITLAGHAAAMAPGTSIGAASPVSMEGEMGETERRKAENIIIADLKSLTEGRSPEAQEWVEKAVRESAALTASEALEMGLIDVVAPSSEDLLRQLDGLAVSVRGRELTLSTADVALERLPMNAVEQFMHILLDPNVAFILLTIGINALLFELSSPGGYVAGIVGVVCLLLGFFAMGVLSVNWAGLGLILLAFALFVAEVLAPTHGILTIMGLIVFVLGSLILFNSPLYQVSWVLVASVALFTAVFFGFVVTKVISAHRRPAATGRQGLVGAIAEVRQPLNPHGMVFVRGELWSAESTVGPVPVGEQVRVVDAQGLRLKVEPVGESPSPERGGEHGA